MPAPQPCPAGFRCPGGTDSKVLEAPLVLRLLCVCWGAKGRGWVGLAAPGALPRPSARCGGTHPSAVPVPGPCFLTRSPRAPSCAPGLPHPLLARPVVQSHVGPLRGLHEWLLRAHPWYQPDLLWTVPRRCVRSRGTPVMHWPRSAGPCSVCVHRVAAPAIPVPHALFVCLFVCCCCCWCCSVGGGLCSLHLNCSHPRAPPPPPPWLPTFTHASLLPLPPCTPTRPLVLGRATGFHCPGNTAEPMACPPGTYCPVGTQHWGDKWCPRGKWSSDPAVPCQNCSAGYQGGGGSTSPTCNGEPLVWVAVVPAGQQCLALCVCVGGGGPCRGKDVGLCVGR